MRTAATASVLTALVLAFSAVPALAYVPGFADHAAVLGQGRMELFLDLESADFDGTNVMGMAATFTYGLNQQIDLWGQLPYIFDNGFDESGIYDITVGLKWAFSKAGEWDLALSPYLTLPTGDETVGLGYGEVNFGANLIASWAQPNKGPWAVNVNFGLFTNNGGSDELGFALAGAGEYAVDPKWTLLGELTIEDDGAFTSDYLLMGAAYTLSADVELKGGLKFGLNDDSADSIILLGATFAL